MPQNIVCMLLTICVTNEQGLHTTGVHLIEKYNCYLDFSKITITLNVGQRHQSYKA